MENNTQQEVKDEFLKVFKEFSIVSFYPESSQYINNYYYNLCKRFYSMIKEGLFDIVFKNKDLELTSINLVKRIIDMMKMQLRFLKQAISFQEPSKEELREMLTIKLTQILVFAIRLQKNEIEEWYGK